MYAGSSKGDSTGAAAAVEHQWRCTVRSRKPDGWVGPWGHEQSLRHQEPVKEWHGSWPSRKMKGRKRSLSGGRDSENLLFRP